MARPAESAAMVHILGCTVDRRRERCVGAAAVAGERCTGILGCSFVAERWEKESLRETRCYYETNESIIIYPKERLSAWLWFLNASPGAFQGVEGARHIVDRTKMQYRSVATIPALSTVFSTLSSLTLTGERQHALPARGSSDCPLHKRLDNALVTFIIRPQLHFAVLPKKGIWLHKLPSWFRFQGNNLSPLLVLTVHGAEWVIELLARLYIGNTSPHVDTAEHPTERWFPVGQYLGAIDAGMDRPSYQVMIDTYDATTVKQQVFEDGETCLGLESASE